MLKTNKPDKRYLITSMDVSCICFMHFGCNLMSQVGILALIFVDVVSLFLEGDILTI